MKVYERMTGLSRVFSHSSTFH